MMTDKLQKELEGIGFQEKEARVYLAGLELGQATAQQIAHKADVKRPTTYFILESLMSQGLASSFHQGKKQFFVVEAPERLLEVLDQERKEIAVREEKFRALLPQLRSINNRQKDKPVVKYYEGKEGILSMVEEYTRASRGQQAYLAYSQDVTEKVFSASELKSLNGTKESAEIKTKAIYTWTKGKLDSTRDSDKVKVSAEKFPISCDVAVYDDKIRIASLKERLVGVLIEDREIAKTFQTIFRLARIGAKSVEQGFSVEE